MHGQSSLADETTSIPLQVEADQAALSQDVASRSSLRFLRVGLGMAVLMLLAVSVCAAHPLTLDASEESSSLVREVASFNFMPSLGYQGIRPAASPSSSQAPGVLRVARSDLNRPRGKWSRGAIVMMGRKFENNKLKMAKTALAYTKKAAYIGKKITQAVQEGGPDMDSNRRLGLLIKEANTLGVKRDVVDRNIKKATEAPTDYKELTYEAYGNEGVAFIINSLADNVNRAASEVNTAVKKLDSKLGGFKMAASGSVLFNFERKGRLAITKELSEDDMIEIAIEAGVDDVELAEPDEGAGDGENVKAVVYTAATDLGAMQAALQAADYDCAGGLVYVPMKRVKMSDEALEKNLAALDRLEELDDVDSVDHNMELSAA